MFNPRHDEVRAQETLGLKVAMAFLVFAFISFVGFGTASAQPDTSVNEPITSGALIIAMDNTKQGDASGCSGPDFNLKAYGLIARLLHNNIPVKWAIDNKATKDATDFSVNATRVAGQACENGPAAFNFAGGPFIVVAEYAALALPVINTFNGEITGTDNDVRVYQANAGFTAPIRYTLTHKPLIAVGPVNGGWGGDPHTTLFTEAKLTGYFAPVADIDIGPSSCYTMATQAHATSAPFYSAFKQFVENGGNFLVQCESITHYEQNQSPRFQTANGFNLFGNSSQFPTRPDGTSNASMAFDNPAMAYNQFVGAFPGDVQGAVSEFSVIGGDGNFINNTKSAVRNTNAGWTTTHVAAVGRIPTTTGGGGHVFTLGGHDYYRDTTPTTANLARRNAQRMILNAVLIPSVRPAGCSLDIPLVKGFKYVEPMLNTADDVAPVGILNPGDTITWTVRYINNGLTPVPNFQIVDNLQAGLVFQSATVSTSGAGTIAALNPSYNGVGANNNVLQSGAILGVGGMVTVKIRTAVSNWVTYLNHPTAYGTGMPIGGVKTDTVDNTTGGTFGGYPIGCQVGQTCYPQDDWQTTGLDPTGIQLVGVTAATASIDGRVQTADGLGIRGAMLTLLDAETGEMRTAVTSTFGYYRFEDVVVGRFYVVSVASKRYEFSVSTRGFSLDDNLTGIDFTADGGIFLKPSPESKVPMKSTNSGKTATTVLSVGRPGKRQR